MPRPDTEAWPYIEARHKGAKRTGTVRLLVIHTPEWKESPSGAEGVARYFATMDDGRVASAHICIDSDTIVQCVKDSYVAFAAPGANHDGIQIELTGYANQTAAQWLDKFSLAAVALCADAVAQYCRKYGLPCVHLTDAQLGSGARGIVGHDQVTRVYQRSSHTDPGPHFPWARLIATAKALIDERGGPT
jgi:hypothetical protein